MPPRTTRKAGLRNGAPTIIDVARQADVSVGTVSNVLNGMLGVSPERRRRVLEAIEHLGFKQNMLAQGLRRNSSSVVGLCVPLTSTSYFAALVDAFESVAASRNFAIMQVLTRQDPAAELERIGKLLSYRVAGILLVPSISPDASYDLIRKSGVPLVVVDRPARRQAFDQVIFANRKAMYDAARQLIAQGHRRILFCVQQPQLSVTIDRREGLNQAVREAPATVAAELLVCEPEEARFARQLERAMRAPSPPTVVIASNSTLAAWVIRALHALQLRCPEEVSLLTFGEPDWADLVSPRLSFVRQPIHEIAVSAWELLIQRMNKDSGKPRLLELEGTLLLQESVGPPPPESTAPARRRYV